MDKQHNETDNHKPLHKKSYVAKIVKGLIYLVVALVVFVVMLYGALSIPAVQHKLVNFALGELRTLLKTDVQIDGVRLRLFNHVDLKGVYIEDQTKDTLLYVGNLDVSISPWSLLRNKLVINEIFLEDVTANLSQQTPTSDLNFQFIIDAFASSDTTTMVDTTKSSLIVDIVDITLKNVNFRYDILSDTLTPSIFNPSHIHVSELNANVKLPSVDPKSFDITLVSLALKEQSGVQINNLSAHFTSDKDAYRLSDVSLSLPHSELKIPSAYYNVATNEVSLVTKRSTLSALDLSPFMPELKYLQNDIVIETSLKGKLPLVNVENLFVSYGDATTIKAKGEISNYERLDLAELSLDITKFLITPDAILDFAKLGDPAFVSPDILNTLGNIRLTGNLKGKLSNLNLRAEAWARQGAILLNASGSVDTTFQNYTVRAGLRTQNFNLGGLLADPEFGRLSMHIDLTATQRGNRPPNASLMGEVNSLHYHKRNYSHIPFSAYYNAEKMGAWIKANLPAGKLEAEANMTQERIPQIDFDVNVGQLQIDRFIDSLEWKNPLLSFRLKGNLIGLDPAKINGNVAIEDLVFSRDSLSFSPEKITLQAGFRNDSVKYITLNSSLLKANIEGIYNFRTLSDELLPIMHQYLPGLFPEDKPQKEIKGQNNFAFSFVLNETRDVSSAFDLPMDVRKPMIISGVVNTKDNILKAVADAPWVDYGDLKIQNTRFDITNNDRSIDLLGKLLFDSGSDKIQLNLDTSIKSDTINALLTAKTDSTNYSFEGSVNTLVNLHLSPKGELTSYIHLLPTNLQMGKVKLSLLDAEVVNDGDKTRISNFGLALANKERSTRLFGIDGVISDQKTDTLKVSFFKAHLGELLQAFDIKNMSAVADGTIKIMNIMDRPELYTNNMTLSDIVIFNDTLGDLSIKSSWSEEARAIGLLMDLQKADSKSELRGWIYPSQDSLNLKLNLNRLDIAWLQPFMADILNKASGSISTGLNIKGRISTPLVDGWLGVNDTYLGIDYTNVTYHISDTIRIEPDRIGFKNLVIEDNQKNKATLDALVTHNNFEDIRYSLDMNLNNLLVLNTAARTDSLFYGRVFASGTVNVKGSDDLIDLKMKIRNGRNSTLNVQVPQTSQASVYQSVVYINVPEEHIIESLVKNVQETMPMRLAVDLTVSPDFQMGVIINPVTGDAMQVKGSGLIKFSYDMRSEAMTTFGDYIVSDGWVRLKLQNIKTVEFKIREGSKLVFNGDPLKTSFEITAFRRVRTDLSTLDPSFGDDPNNPSRVNVDCELIIKGNMDKMDVSYDISLPDASDETKQRVRSLIATENQKTVQFAFLIATGSFHSSGTSSGPGLTDGMFTNMASAALSSGLNALLGSALGDKWQIGTNISSNNGTFSDMDMTVSLSGKFLEDKLEFNSNVGYRTDQTNADNTLIGDFDIAYALSRNVKVKAFNRTNERLYRQAPTTQGIGLVYTKEAKKIKELFQFFRKRRNHRTQEQKQVQTEGSK